jgi:hypothetical protein
MKLTATLALAACGGAVLGCGSTAKVSGQPAPMAAPDARAYLEHRLSARPDFGCAIMPTARTVRVIARTEKPLRDARALVPMLARHRKL